MNVQILQGHQADALLADEAFRAEWSALLAQCPWATAFQSPAFVTTWYQSYAARFQPVLVLARDENSHLRGLFTLARRTSGEDLVVAGAWHAEYHAWICAPAHGDSFPAHAFAALRKAFPHDNLRMQYLPPNTPIGWIANSGFKNTTLLKSHRRPLMHFGNGEEAAKSLNKSNNKSRLKKMEKLGKIEFKRITDPGELEQVFDQIIAHHDARHMAVRGSAPFHNDPLKRPFHLAMVKTPGLIHATVLKVGNQVVAAHLGAPTGKELQLGLIAHNPWYAKHSPGKFLIHFLARMLHQEGFVQLDLTAGGDPYKERFANAWDTVHTLTVFPTAHQRRMASVQHHLADAAKRSLAAMRVKPGRAKLMARKVLAQLHPVTGPTLALRAARTWLGSRQECRIYSIATRDIRETNGVDLIRRDALEDLLSYHPVTPGAPPLQQFLSDAIERIETGQHLYTRAKGGSLHHLAWLAERPTDEQAAAALPGFTIPANCALILDVHTAPESRNRGLATASIKAMLHDAARVPGTEAVYIAVATDNHKARKLVEKLGFTYVQSLYEETRMGWRRRWTAVSTATAALVNQASLEFARNTI
jgi:CelD/BcsL family acetyltransferase involved in cellulose biosynthesis/GNAT superfamily N-acetyltransferase